MKTYIIICCFADKVAGGPIYYANKVRYMKENGWNVAVIPADTGEKSAVRGLDEYFGPYVPYLGYMPSEFNQRQRERIISQLLSFVPSNQEKIIIETGNDYTAYWGELLAKRICAKHIIIFLDEQNPFITNDVIDFYRFKYNRNELACISKPVMQNLFKGMMDLTLEQCKALPCSCTNSIEDYDTPLTEQVGKANYNIGYIGRLEKPFMPEILKGFVSFCESHPENSISITFFGGSYSQTITDEIQNMFRPFTHVTVYITGYLYPLPLKALQKMDVFVSGAGSAIVAAKAGVWSVKVDILSYKPIGVLLNNSNYVKCPIGNTVTDYLEWLLVDKTSVPNPPQPYYMNDWEEVSKNFKQHMTFINNSDSTVEYFNVIGMSTIKGKVKKLLRSLFGVRGYETLHTLFHRIK